MLHWGCILAITTLSSREFNQDTARAKREADKGPVFITDRGRASHVLLSVKEYESLASKKRNILELLDMPGLEEIDPDIEFPRMRDEFPVAPDLSDWIEPAERAG